MFLQPLIKMLKIYARYLIQCTRRSVKMAVYTPEEIVEMADRLMKDISESTKDIAESKEAIDITMATNFIDRCTGIIKSLAENVAELHQRVDVLTEKE